MLIPVHSDIQKFNCSACGTCCSHIRGIVPEEDKKFLEESLFGKMPVVQLIPVGQMTFPLWDWEAKRFMEWQSEANVEARIEPLRAIMDLNSNRAIIISYFMNGETNACPFLKDSKCSIYHTKRAYVCRMFPFNRSPFTEEQLGVKGMFGQCKSMEHILPEVPNKYDERIKFLNSAFPDGSFENSVQNDAVMEWANKAIIELIRSKAIKPAIGYPYKFLLKRIENSQKICFTDFLVECEYMTKKEKEDLITRFDANIDAKENFKKINFMKN